MPRGPVIPEADPGDPRSHAQRLRTAVSVAARSLSREILVYPDHDAHRDAVFQFVFSQGPNRISRVTNPPRRVTICPRRTHRWRGFSPTVLAASVAHSC